MREDECCRPQRRSFPTALAGITAPTAFTATSAGTAHAASADAYADSTRPALQKGSMKLDPARAALVVIDPQTPPGIRSNRDEPSEVMGELVAEFFKFR